VVLYPKYPTLDRSKIMDHIKRIKTECGGKILAPIPRPLMSLFGLLVCRMFFASVLLHASVGISPTSIGNGYLPP